MDESKNFDSTDFEIEKKALARKVAVLVSSFVEAHKLDSIDVNVFITDADASITQNGNIEYGRMLHCVIDADKEFEEDDYE